MPEAAAASQAPLNETLLEQTFFSFIQKNFRWVFQLVLEKKSRTVEDLQKMAKLEKFDLRVIHVNSRSKQFSPEDQVIVAFILTHTRVSFPKGRRTRIDFFFRPIGRVLRPQDFNLY